MGTTGKVLTSAGRREKAVELRILNWNYQMIGNALGISRQAAHKMVSKELARARAKTEDDAATIKSLELARLDRMTAALLPKAVDVDSPDVRAVDRVLKIMERRATLLGLDALAKHAESDSTGQHAAGNGALHEELRRLNVELAELEREIREENERRDSDSTIRHG